MAKHTDSITTTRLTRMIYVEEISDTERRNSTYKSFESETNVEEIMKSTSSVSGSSKKSPGTTPKATSKSKSKSMPVPSLDISKKLAEMTSPLKTMKVAKNVVAPAEIMPIKDKEISVEKDEEPIKAIEHDLTEKANNEKNVQNEVPERPKTADNKAATDENNKEGEKGPLTTATEAKVEAPVLNPNGEVPETTTKGEPSKPTVPANGDVLVNGDVINKEEGLKEEGADAEKEPVQLTMQNETLVQSDNTPSALLNNVEQKPSVADNTPVPTGIQSTDIEKGVVEPEVKESESPLPEMKSFSKHNSSSSLVSGSSARSVKQEDPNQPPSRRSTRRNLLHHMKSKGKFSQLDEGKSISESLLYGTLKPLLILMKCTGIFFIPKKGTFGKTWREFFRSCTTLQIYCLVVCAILFLNFLRSMFAFDATDSFSNTLFLKFLSAIFMYESSSRAALAYWHSYRKTKGLTTFFLTLEQICYSDKIIPYEQEVKRVMQASIIISIAISLSNMGSNAYGLLGSASDQFSSYLVPVPPDAPGVEEMKIFVLILLLINGVVAMKIFVLILLLINGLVAMLSLSFFTTVCYVLYKEFEYLCRTFVMKIKEDGSFNDDLEKFRITHQKRCKLVEDADSMFKYYIANTYMTNVPLLCMLLYIIVYAEGSDLSYRLINAFRLFYVLVQMVVVSWAATMINNQAHAPLDDIYSIKVVSCTSERQLEVNMFLNKLTGTQIGMTAWDMFVINKPTVLTVVGMVLTYFFLLVQFKNPLGEPTQCRCFVNVSSDELRSLVSESTTEMWDMMTYNSTTF